MGTFRNKRGFILIFALWVLGFLSVLAVGLASGVRQKIILVQKLDERGRMRYLLEAAVIQTKAYLRQQMAQAGGLYNPLFKANVHNNPSMFARIILGNDQASVAYAVNDNGPAQEYFGIIDEERKININTTDPVTLARLIERVLVFKPEQAQYLAASILDWRLKGDSQLRGFFSDDYYANLQFPYHKKDYNYEVMDELLLVEGVSKDIYKQLFPYVTIYGAGQVNINTAPPQVLAALGLEDAVIEKILAVRRGQDGVEATLDDHVFTKTFDVTAEVNAVLRLEPLEMRSIDALNLQGRLTTGSYFFVIGVQGRLGHGSAERAARAVYSSTENRILYWKEK